MFVIECIEIIANVIEDDASSIYLPFSFIKKKSQLEKEMFLILKACRGKMNIVAVVRQMHLIEGSLPREKLVLKYERFRQILGNHLPSLKHQSLYYLGYLLSSEASVTQFLRSVIDALKTLADHSVVRVIILYVWMSERESVVEYCSFAEEQIFLSRSEFILNPFKAFKPDQLNRASLIGESSADTCHTRLAVSLHIGDSTDKLIIDGIVINLVYLMYFAAVDISERKIFEQVLKRENTEFFIKKLSTFGAYAFQEFYFRLKNIDHFSRINFGL
jgi:hypothetical protein